MNFIMSLDIEDFLKLIEKCLEKKEEEKAWQMWLTLYPNMSKDNFVPFSEFYANIKYPVSKKSTEDILAEVEQIRAAKNKQKEGE